MVRDMNLKLNTPVIHEGDLANGAIRQLTVAHVRKMLGRLLERWNAHVQNCTLRNPQRMRYLRGAHIILA